MITRITGVLGRVLDEEVRLQVGAFEYQILVPEFVRRTVQGQVGEEFTFHTSHYFDGNPMQGKVVPRLLGFLHEADLEFFELFCTVDGIGTQKALKAMVRPVQGSGRRHRSAGRQMADDAARRRRRDGGEDRRGPATQGRSVQRAPPCRRGRGWRSRRRRTDAEQPSSSVMCWKRRIQP